MDRVIATTSRHVTDVHPPTDTLDQRKIGQRPELRFWEDTRLDLTGATLMDFDFTRCHAAQVRFGGATFTGDALLYRATFTGHARFDEATVTGLASFVHTTFTGDARFDGATLTGGAWFGGTTFTGDTRFDEALVEDPSGTDAWPRGWRLEIGTDGGRPLSPG